MTRDIYNMHQRSKVYLLEQLENFGSDHVVDVTGLLEKKKLTIEHIMPQTLTPIWTASLGPNSDEKHAKWLHTIGNLTLTAYNSKYSNRSFQEKLEMHDGFKESKLSINHYVMQCIEWGEVEIENRARILTERAAKRWPMIELTFKPEKHSDETVTLVEGESFTFKQIRSFEFKGIERIADSWTTLYEYVLKALYDQDPGLMISIIKEPEQNPSLRTILSLDKVSLRMPLNIGDIIFAESNLDTDRKMQVIKDLLDVYEEDISNLSITLKSTNSIEIMDDIDSLDANNIPRIVLTDFWQDLLLDKSVFRSPNLKLLLTLYDNSDKKQVAKMLANELNISVSALNGQIIALGKRIINKTSIPRQFRLDGSERFWNICFQGESSGSLFTFVLRPELEQAMRKIGVDNIRTIADKALTSSVNETGTRYLIFWKQALQVLNNNTDTFSERQPSQDSWMNFGSGISGFEYGFNISQKDCSAYFIMQRFDKEENKRTFDFLESKKADIQICFGGELEWNRLDDKKASTIIARLNSVDIRNEIQWPSAIEFMVQNLIKIQKTISPYIHEMRKFIN